MKYYNRRTNITASIMGILLGLSGILNHGLFEILQGNTATNGFFIEAIGMKQRFWLHGTEAAFTLIHNYLLTGILAVLVGLALTTWSAKYLHTKRGATVFLILLLLLTAVGGGVGYIILFLPVWAFATRINKSLEWWDNRIPQKRRKALSSVWLYTFIATQLSWLMVMQLGIFGYFPGIDDPDTALNIVFVFLFSTVLLACVTFISAIAFDIDKKSGKPLNNAKLNIIIK